MNEQNHIGRPNKYATVEQVDDLKELTISEIKNLEKLVNMRFDYQDKALVLQAEKNTAEFSHIKDNIDSLKTYKDTQEGKASQTSVFIGWGIAGLAIIISIVSILR